MTDPTTPAPLDLDALEAQEWIADAAMVEWYSNGFPPEETSYRASLRNAAPRLIELAREAETWKRRYTKTQTALSKVSDLYNGEPCAEIRWQQEREAFTAERDALRVQLQTAREAFSAINAMLSENGTFDDCIRIKMIAADIARAALASITKETQP